MDFGNKKNGLKNPFQRSWETHSYK